MRSKHMESLLEFKCLYFLIIWCISWCWYQVLCLVNGCSYVIWMCIWGSCTHISCEQIYLEIYYLNPSPASARSPQVLFTLLSTAFRLTASPYPSSLSTFLFLTAYAISSGLCSNIFLSYSIEWSLIFKLMWRTLDFNIISFNPLSFYQASPWQAMFCSLSLGHIKAR